MLNRTTNFTIAFLKKVLPKLRVRQSVRELMILLVNQNSSTLRVFNKLPTSYFQRLEQTTKQKDHKKQKQKPALVFSSCPLVEALAYCPNLEHVDLIFNTMLPSKSPEFLVESLHLLQNCKSLQSLTLVTSTMYIEAFMNIIRSGLLFLFVFYFIFSLNCSVFFLFALG
jgi:hypothetical protein